MSIAMKHRQGAETRLILVQSDVGDETVVGDMDRFGEPSLQILSLFTKQFHEILTEPEECRITAGRDTSWSGVKTGLNGLIDEFATPWGPHKGNR